MSASTRFPPALRPRKNPVQQRAFETRDRILVAAARVFTEHGYAGGTTNRIAEAAGLSVGSLYQYFPNKDAILVELVQAHVASSTEMLAQLFADLPQGLEARVRALVVATIGAHAGEHRLHQVIFEEAPRPAAVLRQLVDGEQRLVAATVAMLEDDPEVDVGDVELAARIAVTTVESLVHRFIAREADALDVDAFADELVAMVVRYLRGGTDGAP